MDDRNYGPPPDPGPPTPAAQPAKKKPTQAPQTSVSSFWSKFDTDFPGKVFTILPKNHYASQKAAQSTAHGTVQGQKAYKSYEQAKAECIRDVDRILRECKRTNQKYRDPHFDIEFDLKTHVRKCLDGLTSRIDTMRPKGVKRLTDIFEKPQFYINGPSAGDVRQGGDGDCYLMAALCGLGNMEGLIERVCVKHDDECMKVGVYGFVFHRDGEWRQTIIDDKLYLRAPDYDEATSERDVWDDINRVDSEAEYRKAHQTGSRALYFAQCSEENETWLPLLEKAYAKAHGDFASIDGGFTGEAIEDLTGGVTTEIYCSDIFDKEAFWRDQLMQVRKTFLFGCATGFFSNWLDQPGETRSRDRQGIFEKHAYSIMDAREIPDPKTSVIQRLVKVRNPWGKTEWDGKWSDGSAEWDADWMKLLNHKFGNDGVFWISYEDLLRRYQHFDRTRIFGPEWSVSQCWTSVDVAWTEEYHPTKFRVTLKEKTQVVIVLSQLDNNYFKGLEGPYSFVLQFRLEKADVEDPYDYIVRANESYVMSRSVSTDIELEAGTYIVLMKIKATKNPSQDTIEDLLSAYTQNREKLIQLGLSYDLAHAKGRYIESREEKKERQRRVREQRREEKRKVRKEFRKAAEKLWKKNKKRHDRDAQKKKRLAEKKKAKMTDGDASETAGAIRQGSVSLDAQSSQIPKNASLAQQQSEQNGNKETPSPEQLNAPSGETIETLQGRTGPDSAGVQPENPKTKMGELVEKLEDAIGAPKMEDNQSHERTEPSDTTTKDDGIPPTPTVEINGQKVITDVKPLLTQPKISTPEHTIKPLPPSRTNTIDTTAAQGSLTNGATPSAMDAEEDGGESDASFESFQWDSELDLPSEYASSSSSSSSGSDSEASSSDSDVVLYRPPGSPQRNKRGKKATASSGIPQPPASGAEQKDDESASPGGPWNAVCVVGLRVYSMIGEGVELKVIWPKEDTHQGKGKKGKRKPDPTAEGKLDPDDQAKGAVTAMTEAQKVEDKGSI